MTSKSAGTGFVFHPLYTNHLTGPEHPERPERVLAIVNRLKESGLKSELQTHEPSPADAHWLAEIHDEGYVRYVEEACAGGHRILDSADTSISTGSYQAALLAAGGALEAADKIMDGTWKNAFVACRPPGHHAENKLAMGFCLFNNVAVTAAYLKSKHSLKRVAILDWDVHHGNGTQHAFDADPSVYFASLHQWPLYPGTGRADERGEGDAHGTILNCPMDPGDGDDQYLKTLEETVLPELAKFAPEFIIISAGFDAHEADLISATRVTGEGYRRMSRLVAGLAESVAGGRVLSMLEGGYDLEALADSVQIHLEELIAASGGPAGTD